MAYLSSILMPLEIILPILGSDWVSGPMPLNLALWVYPFRVGVVALTGLLAFYTPLMEPTPWLFWVLMLAVALIGSVANEWMFVSQMAFFAKVSDPAMGGTYMRDDLKGQS